MDKLIIQQENIKNKIYNIRNLQVMLDKDLAELYNVETRVLNQAVKRNIERFPDDFMFQLTKEEFESLISQFVTSNSNRGGVRKLPYAFTEQGISMLASILKSKTAINISVKIIRAFVSIRKLLTENTLVFQKIDIIEQKLTEHDKKFDLILNTNLPTNEGIFYDGQIFDAYAFVSKLIKSAKKEIVLIDNYIDESVLLMLAKSSKNVKTSIYTSKITQQLKLDLDKYNAQYPKIIIKTFKKSHDRFLIIDKKTIYHIGASLKDLGKKWFAFSKINIEINNIINKLEENELD